MPAAVFLKLYFSSCHLHLSDVFLRYCHKYFFAFETCICVVGHLRINGCRDKSVQEANNIYRCRCVSCTAPSLKVFVWRYQTICFKFQIICLKIQEYLFEGCEGCLVCYIWTSTKKLCPLPAVCFGLWSPKLKFVKPPQIRSHIFLEWNSFT